MGSYNSIVITSAGQALLTSIIGTQGTITFSKFQTSSHVYPAGTDLTVLTSLQEVKQEVTPSGAGVLDAVNIYVTVALSNEGVVNTYTANTLGIFASDGNDEVLFGVATGISPDVIPADSGGAPSSYTYRMQLAISSTSNITIAVDPGAYASSQDFMDHVDSKVNSASGVHGLKYQDETLSAYNSATQQWEEIKTGGGGSTIVITAGSDALVGKDIVISDGTNSVTQVMPANMKCVFEGITMTGTLLVSCDLVSILAETSIEVPYYGNYEAELNVGETFTLLIDTTESTLRGKTVTVAGTNYTKTGTMPATGALNMKVTYEGELTITATDGTSTATKKVTTVAGTSSYSVTLAFTTGIYGASWDGTSTTAWTRTDDAEEYTDPVPYVAGATNYGSPFDDKLPWSGMTKSTRNGNSVVAIPKFWYKITQDGAGMTVKISDHEETGYSVSPAHMNRGDGSGERDTVYVGRYHCDSSYKSTTGVKPVANITRSAARTAIHNTNSKIWQMDFATRFTLWLLYIVEFADWNSQAKIGYGCGDNSATGNMGYTDSMPYHTGTTQANRTTYGLGTQYRNIEGLWDNVYDWIDGCYYDSNGMNIIKNPSSFSDTTGGTSVGTPTSGWPAAFSVKSVSGTYGMFIPSATGGSESTYSCDFWVFVASGPCLYVGGYYSQGGVLGLFYVYCYSATSASAGIGCRLLELP